MANEPSGNVPRPRVRFHYIKGNFFRVVHVDGIIGGWNPLGLLHMATYSERPAIPQVTEHELREPTLGPAETIEGKAGIVRELDVDLMLSKERATELRDWLTERLKDLDRLTARDVTQ